MSERAEQLRKMIDEVSNLTNTLSQLLAGSDLEQKLTNILNKAEESLEGGEAGEDADYWRNLVEYFRKYYEDLYREREEKKRKKSATSGKGRPKRVIYERPRPELRVIEEHYELLKEACTYILHNIIGIQSIMPASETAIDVYRLCLGTRHLANALRDLLDIIAYERLKVVPETEIVEAGE